MSNRPKDALLAGIRELERVLRPRRFRFRFRRAGRGSGGDFAWGEFVHRNRRLELHFRQGLGLVCYHLGEQSVSHEAYMRELGVWDQCLYPGFSADPMRAFNDLAHDLCFADDFLVGSATILQQAATKEAAATAARTAYNKAGYVGDRQKIEKLRGCFREKRYGAVLKLAQELKYPSLMSEPERKMIEIARKRAGTDAPPNS